MREVEVTTVTASCAPVDCASNECTLDTACCLNERLRAEIRCGMASDE